MKAADFIIEVLIRKNRMDLNDTQILMLLSLAQAERPMTTVELVEKLRVSRFVIGYALKLFRDDEVTASGPTAGGDKYYTLQPSGEAKLRKLLTQS